MYIKIKPLYIKIIERNECKESENNENYGILKVIQFHQFQVHIAT